MEETFNVWCDRIASHEWLYGTHSVYDPDVSPQEQWGILALHSVHHKLIGNMSIDVACTLLWDSTATYIHRKHGLSFSKLQHVNTNALKQYILSLPITKCANIVKVMHGWVPTYASLCRQGWEHSSLCPRCNCRVETVDRIHICAHPSATQCHQTLLQTFLSSLSKMHTPMQIIYVLNNKLSQVLELPPRIQKFEYTTLSHNSTSHQTSEYNRMGLVPQGLYLYLLVTYIQ
jgi:hypothetical protein